MGDGEWVMVDGGPIAHPVSAGERRVLGGLFVAAAAAVSVPVLVTVAAAFEPQSFVLVYALAAALVVDEAVRPGSGLSSRRDEDTA